MVLVLSRQFDDLVTHGLLLSALGLVCLLVQLLVVLALAEEVRGEQLVLALGLLVVLLDSLEPQRQLIKCQISQVFVF